MAGWSRGSKPAASPTSSASGSVGPTSARAWRWTRWPRRRALPPAFPLNVDGHAAQRTLAGLDPARTAAILISKTFGTQETLLNGGIVRAWLGDDARLFAVSANLERAAAFGIAPERILPMWDWVGGRYSLWSAVGFPVALAIGMANFERLLAGAAAMDAHAARRRWNATSPRGMRWRRCGTATRSAPRPRPCCRTTNA